MVPPPPPNISTVAGSATDGFSGDGGPATAARLENPRAVAVDAGGNMFIADTDNSRVRKVTASGVISTVAGTGAFGFGGDGGPATAAQLNQPYGVAVGNDGSVFIADRFNHRVRKVDPSGTISTVAGTGVSGFSGDGGLATAAQLSYPARLAIATNGDLFIADTDNQRVRKVNPSGTITTVAGTGTKGFSGDGGPATSAQLFTPFGIAVDAGGNLFIVDTDNARVRKVSPSGTISTVAGSGVNGFSGDGGPATAAQLNGPMAVAVDAKGRLFIADYGNARVRQVDPVSAMISTVAGTGVNGFSGDGGPATAAQLNLPFGVAVANGKLLIADLKNHRIRTVSGM
jgi:sugar lactone lactonase YvrE